MKRYNRTSITLLQNDLATLFEDEKDIVSGSKVFKKDALSGPSVEKSEDPGMEYIINISNITLHDDYAKLFFNHFRKKFKNWKYDDTFLNWQPEVVNKALKGYKKFMLDIVLGMTHGDVEPKGLLEDLAFLKLQEIYDLLIGQDPDTKTLSEELLRVVEIYMKMVFPFEKRILFDLYQKGYVSTHGELQGLAEAIEFLKVREPDQYKGEQEKELDQETTGLSEGKSSPSDVQKNSAE